MLALMSDLASGPNFKDVTAFLCPESVVTLVQLFTTSILRREEARGVARESGGETRPTPTGRTHVILSDA